MATKGFKRKLTSIFSTDAVGYSRLMGDDEVATVRTITSYRKIISTLIKQHNGRVIDSPGDNLLAEFVSVVDTVQCAVAVQKELKVRNGELPENRRMQFRIGINLGDVIQEGARIYGDGVNIAARIESLAEPGMVSISRTVYNHVHKKLNFGYEYQGEHQVKNIAEPVKVYKVLTTPEHAGQLIGETNETKLTSKKSQIAIIAILALIIAAVIWHFYPRAHEIEPASVEKMAYPLPDKPSIAVLPFNNMSGDPEQEYFSDGITEDLITDLSQISGLFIISRNSTFTFKGKAIKIRKVAEELGVRYLLEGSVRKAGDNVRINAQLIDATTGGHVWAKRYDGKLVDVFALQDQITQKIVAAMKVKLAPGEQRQVENKDTANVQAYDAFLKGWGHHLRFTAEDFVKAVAYFTEAAELDSNYGRAYAALALTYKKASDLHWNIELGVSWIEARLLARQFLHKAMQNPTSLAHQVASEMNLNRRQYDEAISSAELAMTIDPNDPNCHAQMARALIFGGRPNDAVNFVNGALRRDPSNPARYLFLSGLAQFAMGKLPQSAELIEKALSYNPEARLWAAPLAAAFAHIGRDLEAQAACANFKKAYGEDVYSNLRNIMYYWPFEDPAVVERFVNGIVDAGFRGHPEAYYTASVENRLSGEKIKNLIFGQEVLQVFDPILPGTGRALIFLSKKGEASYWKGPIFEIGPELARLESEGTSLIKGDLLCYQWQELLDGEVYCGPIFSNPQGTPEGKNEYLFATDFDIIFFSILTKEEYELVRKLDSR
jgi:TolB-like protein/class 3 adenylate cyclase/Tfp pilus assembly protein PilF